MTHKTSGNVINIKTGLAEMLKGGVIMDVVTAEQARVAENAGAVANGCHQAQRAVVERLQEVLGKCFGLGCIECGNLFASRHR